MDVVVEGFGASVAAFYSVLRCCFCVRSFHHALSLQPHLLSRRSGCGLLCVCGRVGRVGTGCVCGGCGTSVAEFCCVFTVLFCVRSIVPSSPRTCSRVWLCAEERGVDVFAEVVEFTDSGGVAVSFHFAGHFIHLIAGPHSSNINLTSSLTHHTLTLP